MPSELGCATTRGAADDDDDEGALGVSWMSANAGASEAGGCTSFSLSMRRRLC